MMILYNLWISCFSFKTNGSPAISRTSDHDYDHENHHEISPLPTNKDKRKEFTSVGNSTSKSPTKDSQLKPTNTEVSHTSPPQPSPTNGTTETLELSKRNKLIEFRILIEFL
jgi:U3 small nucleolar ribonucleoprotein component